VFEQNLDSVRREVLTRRAIAVHEPCVEAYVFTFG
jgi:hypothetical protein